MTESGKKALEQIMTVIPNDGVYRITSDNIRTIASYVATLEARASAAEKRLAFFEENPGCELSRQESELEGEMEWVVFRLSGGVNDREWTPIGKGETPAQAIDAARAAITGAKTDVDS